MVSLVQKTLIPMDLKKYMILSFATLWTVVLIIALIATIIHQVNFQKSSDRLHLEWEVAGLSQDLRELEVERTKLKITINQVLSDPYYE